MKLRHVLKSIIHYWFTDLVMLCIDGHNNVGNIWENIKLIMQKRDFKLVLWSYNK